MKKRIGIIIISLLTLSSVWAADVDQMAELLMKAHTEKQSVPYVSQHDPNIDLAGAYQIQNKYVMRLAQNDRVAGFKAGFTSKKAQEAWGVSEPVAGVLFASGTVQSSPSPVIDLSNFKRLLIETEFGFEMETAITHPVAQAAELKGKVRVVRPMIELPDAGFEDMKKATGLDLVAANVVASHFIVGPSKDPGALDLNQLTVTLTKDDKQINRWEGVKADDEQWENLRWLVNKTIENGYTIEPGNIFITGARGKLLPGLPGKYVADFGELGTISFEVRAP